MQTIKVDLTNLNKEEYTKEIKRAAQIIQNGGIVAFPTETVYGLGADALNEDAVLKIFKAKGRPQDNPLIMHVCNFNINPYVKDFNPMHIALFKEFWPGPLTILFKKSNLVPNRTTANLDTVGIRMPDNKVAQDLIFYSNTPIAAPSANISGLPSPTTFKRCVEDLDGKVDMILGYDQSKVGVESTIVDMTRDVPEILRPGAITLEDLERVLGNVNYEDVGLLKDGEVPKAPGMKYTHYSPKASVRLLFGSLDEKLKYINKNTSNNKIRFILFNEELFSKVNKNINNHNNIIMYKNLKEALYSIFETLRESDDLGFNEVVIEAVTEEGLGLTLMNRLKKSSGYNFIKLSE